MDATSLVIGLGAGVTAGGLVGWALGRARARLAAEVDAQRAEARAQAAEAASAARVEELRRALVEQRSLYDEVRERLGGAFEEAAAAALARTQQGFMQMATDRLEVARGEAVRDLDQRHKAVEGLVLPVRESLERVNERIAALDRDRRETSGALGEQLRALGTAQAEVRAEAANLARALRAPQTRGRWGEVQLQRVVELAGMVEHCDFVTQDTTHGGDGARRPDLVVKLPGGREVVVDAKAPMEAFLAAHEARSDEERAARLRDHAAAVRQHVQRLAAKGYWQGRAAAAEFVVLFLPGEALWPAALEADPGIFDEAAAKHVFVATPASLMALLRVVRQGFREERMAEGAAAVSDAGRVLHERVATLLEHFNKLGVSLDRSVEQFNNAMASLEGRLMPAARRLSEMGAGGRKDLEAPMRLDSRARRIEPADTEPVVAPDVRSDLDA